MRWAEIERRQPRLAEVGRQKLAEPGVVLVGTVRKDGTARISPVEPFFWEGDLWLPMGLGSTKARDLQREPRVLVHSIVTSRDGRAGEYKVRGEATLETDRSLNQRIAAAIAEQLGWRPEVGEFHLFRVAVDDITFIRWGEDNDQYVTRWPEGGEYVRRGTSATSVGPPEPVADLLD
jgi:general stress protein 26